MIEQLAFGSIFIATAVAAYTDWKTGYIYNWITYPLIAIGIILSLVQQQWLGLVMGGLIYGAGYLAYNQGKLGGGDVKLLTGMALVQPVFHGMIFVLSVLLTSALAACVGMGVYYVGGYLLTKPKIEWNTPRKRAGALLLIGVIAMMYYGAMQGVWNSLTLAALGLGLGMGILFYALEPELKTHHFLRRVHVKEIEDDEIVAEEQLTHEEKKRFGKSVPALIGMDDKLRLMHLGFTTIPLYRDLPRFAPYLLAGVIWVFLFPETLNGIVPLI